MPRAEKVSKRRGRQRLLQPSIHPLIEDYEKAQDDVGAFFSEIGLRRGERSAAARRRAQETGLPPPDRREHLRPSRWREEEAAKLRAETERIEADRRATAMEAERAEQLRREAESALSEARRVKAEAEQLRAEAAVRERGVGAFALRDWKHSKR
jgi:hypothetical protein